MALTPLIAALTLAATPVSACAPARAPSPVETVRAMYAAAMAGDDKALLATFTPDYYAFEGGRRVSALDLVAMLGKARARHEAYAWSVQDPDVRRHCDTALVTYTNRGTLVDAKGAHPLVWLESAYLVWQDKGWRIAFFHSTRAAS